MILWIILVFVIAGFIYGRKYFRYNESYGLDGYPPLGRYILSIKWWNVEINYYTYRSKWFLVVNLIFPAIGKSNIRFDRYYYSLSGNLK